MQVAIRPGVGMALAGLVASAMAGVILLAAWTFSTPAVLALSSADVADAHAAVRLNEPAELPTEVTLASAGDTGALSLLDPAPINPTRVSAVRVTNAATRAVPAAPRVSPRDAVLNEAQIAGIKKRLKLTPQQEQMWPSVEAALRGMTYAKKGRAPAAVDTESEAVKSLKSAAEPLIMSFNADQKQELRQLAIVVGLEKLAAKY